MALARKVTKTEAGDTWFEIDSAESARHAGQLSGTAAGWFYEREAVVENGGHPRRWFELVGPDETGNAIGKVSVCVLPEGAETADPEFAADCHTKGFRNKPPYSDHADDVEALSEAVGIDLPPNYQGTPVPSSAPAGPRP